MACDPSACARRLIGSVVALVGLMVVLPASAQEAGADCARFTFDAREPTALARIATTAPKAYFVRGRSDDASCPADTAACRTKSYLVSGDLVLTGATRGAFTCVTYQNVRSGFITSGWIASASLAVAASAPAAQPADWAGTWRQPGGRIVIKPAPNGALAITGEHSYPVAGGVRSTEIAARAVPANGILAFADDGATPFDQAAEGACLMRMRRLDALLIVEDNGQCGDGMVSFTGLYQRGR